VRHKWSLDQLAHKKLHTTPLLFQKMTALVLQPFCLVIIITQSLILKRDEVIQTEKSFLSYFSKCLIFTGAYSLMTF